MIYGFVIVVAALGVAIYLTVVLRAVPGAVDERLGRLEALPSSIGEWVRDRDSDEAKAADSEGLIRETRILLEPARGFFGRERLVRQSRYRAGEGGKIVRVDPEERWSRKRVKV